ncbi:methionine adenosyltransferase [Micrococcales bacterium 31B]|nr:methionine adenosyltransferase [Micrococcales bacterium 31B]
MRLFTSESVTEGHPDKIADAISDAILDAHLAQDPTARVACEVLTSQNLVVIAGEVTSNATVDHEAIARATIIRIGYDSAEKDFDGATCKIIDTVGTQSADIAHGVDNALEKRDDGHLADDLSQQGAGDQGLMFGFACDDTADLMPLPIYLAHRLSERLAEVRHEGILDYIYPDGKTQVTIGYDDHGHALRVDTIVISTQVARHYPGMEALKRDVRREVIDHVLAPITQIDTSSPRVFINPAGEWFTGGPVGDAGLTGRKIIVDTYGGYARHGGGAFSGKDPSKVDRSGAYAMRWVAKNVVAAGLASRCEVQVAYAIGKAEPVGLYVETFGTGTVADSRIQEAVRKVFDLRPQAIIRDLEMLRPVYGPTAAYGHFGREGFAWEATNRVDDLRAAVGL